MQRGVGELSARLHLTIRVAPLGAPSPLAHRHAPLASQSPPVLTITLPFFSPRRCATSLLSSLRSAARLCWTATPAPPAPPTLSWPWISSWVSPARPPPTCVLWPWRLTPCWRPQRSALSCRSPPKVPPQRLLRLPLACIEIEHSDPLVGVVAIDQHGTCVPLHRASRVRPAWPRLLRLLPPAGGCALAAQRQHHTQ